MFKVLCTKHIKDDYWETEYEHIKINVKTDHFHVNRDMTEWENKIKDGYIIENDEMLNGLYIEKELFFAVAMWISHEFYLKCVSRIINYHYELKKKCITLKQKLNLTKPDIVPRTVCKSRQHMFVLLKIGESEYYAMRTQKGNYKAALKKIKLKHPQTNQIFEMYSPNCVNFFIRLHKNKNIFISHNTIKLIDNYTEDKFIHDIKKLAMKGL